MKRSHRAHHFLTLLIFGLIAAAHLIRLRGLEMNPDETWHIWQTFGTPDQILTWTPYDWTPLYVLLLGGWRLAVGLHPFMLHMLSLLFSLIGSAFAFQTGRRIGGYWVGLFTLLIYSGLAYSAFLSGYIRPYALAHALIPLGFYFTLRCFESPRLRIIPMLALTLTLIASFYTTLIAPLWIACFGIYTLIVYPLRRTLFRWLPIALAFVLASIPILIARGSVAADRAIIAERPPFLSGVAAIGSEYGGDVSAIWLTLLIIGIVAWITRRTRIRPLIGLAVWGIGGLIGIYFLHPVLGFFLPSYLFWTLPAFALIGGLLLAALPRMGKIGVLALLTVLVFVPIPSRIEVNYAPPGVSVFTWLRDHVRAGDVVALDPGFDCLKPFELDYYTRAFFPAGLPIVSTATTSEIPQARRVWYAVNVNTQDSAYTDALTANRIPSIFVGPPTCLFRLYEAPPDAAGTLFANGMRLHGAEMIVPAADQLVPLQTPPVAHEGEPITVRLWWSTDVAQPADYSVGLYLLNPAREVVMHVDSAPAVDPSETSRWQTGTLYVEDRTFTLPYPMKPRNYQVAVTVYQWWDNTRFEALGADENRLLPVFTLSVMSWSRDPESSALAQPTYSESERPVEH